jgi:hypothetical protein
MRDLSLETAEAKAKAKSEGAFKKITDKLVTLDGMALSDAMEFGVLINQGLRRCARSRSIQLDSRAADGSNAQAEEHHRAAFRTLEGLVNEHKESCKTKTREPERERCAVDP